MGLKILHSADWHLDSPFTQVSPSQREYLHRQLLRIPERISRLCREENCDLVLLSGDLFDGPYTKKSVQALRRALEACAVPVFISPGNHDFLTPDSPWMAEQWPENVHIFSGGLTNVAVPWLNCRVWGAGYQSMDCPGLLEGFRAEGTEMYQLGVLHGDPIQLKSPYCPVTAAQVRDSGLDYLALGHVHKAGAFRAGGTLCGWPGGPMGRGYDEQGEKGVYIVTLDRQAELRFLPLDTPRFFDLELDTDRASLADLLPGGGSDAFYRITLTGSGETGELPGEFPNLELTDRREAPLDPWANAGEDSLEGVYFRMLREKLEEADPETEQCVSLAAEISARLLQGREVPL